VAALLTRCSRDGTLDAARRVALCGSVESGGALGAAQREAVWLCSAACGVRRDMRHGAARRGLVQRGTARREATGARREVRGAEREAGGCRKDVSCDRADDMHAGDVAAVLDALRGGDELGREMWEWQRR